MIKFNILDDRLQYDEHLTDSELSRLKTYYFDLVESLSRCYKKGYKLVFYDATNNLSKINEYISARKKHD